MIKLSAIAPLVFLFALLPSAAFAQEQPSWEVQALNQVVPGAPIGNVVYDMASGTAHGTNGVFVRYGATVMTADSVSVNSQTGEAVADGKVHISMGGQIWTG